MDDAEEWTVFAPIARLESLDELDQVRYIASPLSLMYT